MVGCSTCTFGCDACQGLPCGLQYLHTQPLCLLGSLSLLALLVHFVVYCLLGHCGSHTSVLTGVTVVGTFQVDTRSDAFKHYIYLTLVCPYVHCNARYNRK